VADKPREARRAMIPGVASRYDDELWRLVPAEEAPPPHLRRFVSGLGQGECALDLGCGDDLPRGISEAYAEGDGAAFRAQHGLEQASPLIALVGNVCAARAQDTAVRALAAVRERLPRAQLVVAGLPHPRPADEAFAPR
jgi:hypothetical protein